MKAINAVLLIIFLIGISMIISRLDQPNIIGNAAPYLVLPIIIFLGGYLYKRLFRKFPT